MRRKDEYDGKTILNAKWHDPEQVTEWASDLSPDKEIVLYFAGGGSVSNNVLDQLLAKNIKARYIEGGIEAWKKMGARSQKHRDPLNSRRTLEIFRPGSAAMHT